jgi:hypothetical protein
MADQAEPRYWSLGMLIPALTHPGKTQQCDERPVHQIEVHQRTIAREATRQRVFREISEGPISNRSRKLARASVSEH